MELCDPSHEKSFWTCRLDHDQPALVLPSENIDYAATLACVRLLNTFDTQGVDPFGGPLRETPAPPMLFSSMVLERLQQVFEHKHLREHEDHHDEDACDLLHGLKAVASGHRMTAVANHLFAPRFRLVSEHSSLTEGVCARISISPREPRATNSISDSSPMSEEISKTAGAEHCRFCGTTDARYWGSAHTYVRWPADIALEDGVYHFAICDDCALSTRDNEAVAADQFRPGDRDHLRTCDICGAVGCRSTSVRGWANRKPDGARDDRTYRIQSVLGWTVDIAGFEGGTCSCIECSPIQPVDCVRRPGREYDDDATVLVTPPFEQDGSVSSEDLDAEHRQSDIDIWTT